MALITDRRSLLTGAAGLGTAASLGACANARVVGFDKSRKSIDIANSSEPLSLDPHKATGSWENNIIGNMFIGLTTENSRSEPMPGMAERWEVSEDLLTWTFFLRRDATWSDGEPCDAHDFVFAMQRILKPETLSQYASFLYPLKNAELINNPPEGTEALPAEELGVTAIDDFTLEIQLEHPAPYLRPIRSLSTFMSASATIGSNQRTSSSTGRSSLCAGGRTT
jgi:oligopeptide transport system substrate-binding protein